VIRKYLFVSILLFACLARLPSAEAQVPVIDSSNLAQNIVTAAQEIQAVEQLRAQLTQLENTYTMLTSPTNVLGMTPTLENQAIENPMPTANALAGLVGGQTSPSGSAQIFYNQNHVYSPTDGSAASTQLNTNAASIADIEGMAATNLVAIQQRLQDLPGLESNLNNATSITQLTAINGRIAAESQFVQGQQAQAANLQVLAAEQSRSEDQQAEEEHVQDASTLAAQYQAAGNQ